METVSINLTKWFLPLNFNHLGLHLLSFLHTCWPFKPAHYENYFKFLRWERWPWRPTHHCHHHYWFKIGNFQVQTKTNRSGTTVERPMARRLWGGKEKTVLRGYMNQKFVSFQMDLKSKYNPKFIIANMKPIIHRRILFFRSLFSNTTKDLLKLDNMLNQSRN